MFEQIYCGKAAGYNTMITTKSMNDIYQKQNKDQFIELFRAQGYIYDQAKNYANWIVVISIVVVFGLTILKFVFPDTEYIKTISILYGIFSTVICFLLEAKRKHRKNQAAIIQQLIDCDLFDISWWRNWGKKPALEVIQEAAKKEKADRYINWYDSSIQNVSKQAATIICFRCNVMYDNKLRRGYIKFCHLAFWIIMIVLLGVCFYFNFTILDIVTYGVAPSLPIIMMYVKTWVAESIDTKNLEQIRYDLEQMQERMIAGEVISSDENFIIQDAIFAHRKNSFSIPSLYYKLHRKGNELDMHVFASRLAQELTSR